MNAAEMDTRTSQIIAAAMKVHSSLGPGLLESAYEACLAYELRRSGHCVQSQLELPVRYDGVTIDVGYRIDLLVDDAVIIEVKAISKLHPVHHAQVLSYLKMSGHHVGLILNFHTALLRDGIKRIVNGL
jgi:GxxExxY protein